MANGDRKGQIDALPSNRRCAGKNVMANSPNPKPGASIYELFMLGLCLYVLAALGATTFFKLDESIVAILDHLDTGVCFVFLIDFVVQFTVAENKVSYLKWGWIDLISSIPATGPLRWGRLARVV